jgi:transcription antitermination factor NusG
MSEVITETPEITTVVGAGDAVGVSFSDEADASSQVQTEGAALTPRRWFVACVRPNTEKASRERLEQLGYEAFVASQEEVKYWKNGNRKKRKKVERVVITQYIFVKVTEKERMDIVKQPFIRFFLMDRSCEKRTLATVSDREMDNLKVLLGKADRTVMFASAGFTIGEEVRVTGMGTYEYTGHVVRLSGDNADYVGVRLNVLGCAYMEVSPANLQPII